MLLLTFIWLLQFCRYCFFYLYCNWYSYCYCYSYCYSYCYISSLKIFCKNGTLEIPHKITAVTQNFPAKIPSHIITTSYVIYTFQNLQNKIFQNTRVFSCFNGSIQPVNQSARPAIYDWLISWLHFFLPSP